MKTSARWGGGYRARVNIHQLIEKETTFGALDVGTNAPGQPQLPKAGPPVTLS